MKNFKEPELEVAKFEVEDVLTTASSKGEEDEGPFQPFAFIDSLIESLKD